MESNTRPLGEGNVISSSYLGSSDSGQRLIVFLYIRLLKIYPFISWSESWSYYKRYERDESEYRVDCEWLDTCQGSSNARYLHALC